MPGTNLRRYHRVDGLRNRTVVLSQAQDDALAAIATAEDVSVSTIVREAVDLFLLVRQGGRRAVIADAAEPHHQINGQSA